MNSVLALAVAQTRAPLPNDTLAQCGAIVVTARELLHRLEAVPWPGNEKSTRVEDVRTKALYAIIAEKLMGEEGRRLGLRNDRRSLITTRELENLFIRDALYRKEVSAKIRVSEGEIRRCLQRLPYDLKVLSFLVKNRSEGEILVRQLRQTTPDEVIGRSRYTQVDTITIRFGAPDTLYERAAFSLGNTRVTQPFKSQHFGWAVLYLLDRLPNADVQQMSSAERRRRVEKIIRDRREAALAAEYYFSVLQSHHASAHERMFFRLASSLSDLWLEDTLRYKRNGFFVLTSDMVDVLASRLTPFLDSSLVEIGGDDLSLARVLEMLRYEDLLCKEYHGEAFEREFNDELKSLVARELIARQGRNEGMLERPEVRKDLDVWLRYLSAIALWESIRDTVTVSDDEIVYHLIQNNAVFGKQFEVNVREVLSPTLQEALTVVEECRTGRSLAESARLRSTRSEWSRHDGESDYFVVGEKPEIGYRALLSDTGRILGPFPLKEGYSVFTVLGKRRTSAAMASCDSLRNNVHARLITEKRKQSVNRVIANLARRGNLVIDETRLKTVKPTLIPAFVRRSMGFGGRMNALPMIMQRWEWIKEFQRATVVP